MKTKLVYVVTCAPEASYIEQALMAVWSARYWNPDAHIVLLTDDKTSAILHTDNARGEILKFISEEIVSTFDPDKSMHYRSRWIKTSARELVDGDIIFIDCDTICCRSLESVDMFDCEVGAVLESHLPISELNDVMQHEIDSMARKVGWNKQTEMFYFSSGVIYAKDTPAVHNLYAKWHKNWLNGVGLGINSDQPTLAKANIDCNHLIQRIADGYNCILFTQPQHTQDAYILHIASFRNPSFLFNADTLMYIRAYGLANDWLQAQILFPYYSFRPFEYEILHSCMCQRLSWIKAVAKAEYGYKMQIQGNDTTIYAVLWQITLWMFRIRIHVLRHFDEIKDNVCRK